MSHTVLYSNKAEKFLKNLPVNIAKHIKDEILTLENAQNPKTLPEKD
ncbi:hypothetical protein [Methanospirillum hungatei]|nr:hypothetical protein [Methanospirillum hungatei]MCA1917452.1 hypothetical protein [Methanospirillum hungatei]